MSEDQVFFERLNLPPTYKVVAQKITEMILSGAMKPGSAVPTEQQLCDQFGVNRSSVREGIRLLEETGMLRRINARRLIVSRPTREELGEQLERGLLLHEVTFLELWEAAMVIEPHTAALAAIHLQDSDIAALEENLRATQASLNDPRTLIELDVQFHALVARGVHNRVWQLSREPLARLLYPAAEAVARRVQEAPSRLLKAHRSVVQALKAGDSQASAEWMEKHIKDFKRGFERAGLDMNSPALRPAVRTVASPAATQIPPGMATSTPPPELIGSGE